MNDQSITPVQETSLSLCHVAVANAGWMVTTSSPLVEMPVSCAVRVDAIQPNGKHTKLNNKER